MTARDPPEARRLMAQRGAWTCGITLTAFALGGSLIFRLFGITIGAFKIAGGILIGLNALDMVQARRSQPRETAVEKGPIVMPNRRKMRLPPKANAVRVMPHVQAPRLAMRRRASGGSRAVMARNVGTAVRGSTMNRTDVKMRNRSCSVLRVSLTSRPAPRDPYRRASPRTWPGRPCEATRPFRPRCPRPPRHRHWR